MEYSRVTRFDEDHLAFLTRFRERVGEVPPEAAFVAENESGVAAMILLWSEPNVHVSLIADGHHPVVLPKLADYLDGWLARRGVEYYSFVVHKTDYHYRRIVEQRGAVPGDVREDGYVNYVQPTNPRYTPDEDGIRGWFARDWKRLAHHVRAFLQENYEAGGDYPPTPANVAALVQRGIAATDDGDPALVAWHAGSIVGFVLWAGAASHGLDVRDKVCLGIGTYVQPDYRRKGLSKELRRAALETAKAKGYTRVDGVALDERGLKAGLSVGGRAVGVLVRLAI